MKRKIKGLMPSLKEKKRYLAIKVEPVKLDSSANIKFIGRPLDDLVKQIRLYLGLKGASQAGLMPISFTKNIAIIRVSHNYLDEVRASLLFVRELGSRNVILRSLKASGMVNKVKVL